MRRCGSLLRSLWFLLLLVVVSLLLLFHLQEVSKPSQHQNPGQSSSDPRGSASQSPLRQDPLHQDALCWGLLTITTAELAVVMAKVSAPREPKQTRVLSSICCFQLFL